MHLTPLQICMSPKAAITPLGINTANINPAVYLNITGSTSILLLLLVTSIAFFSTEFLKNIGIKPPTYSRKALNFLYS